ncbi:hypothetical protein PILCRDRAFT_821063 [Piloderma croceum F 1598]|uniref:Golgi to ER traffic protein 2 n=1 Tax=Piloderma croceum (strain F 1598) TaxID=765440 RepID=A0A0C3B652_PILCF|nr:hypothetical protein PILCRDRAFT_821063 [Piloderma croceum F 1598]
MAAARAEARRKAILARGNDRLAKLTTSARGEDHPVYAHQDPPVPTITKDTLAPPRPSSSSSSRSRSQTPSSFEGMGLGDGGTPPPDPSVWSEEQQNAILQALMGGAAPAMPGIAQMPRMAGHGPGQPPLSPMPDAGHDMSDPLAALMAQFSGQGQPGMNTTDFLGKAPTQPTKPVTRLQKLMPLLHLLSVWTLLAYFVFWKEPQAFEAGFGSVGVYTSMIGGRSSLARRWAELGSGIGRDGWGVEAVPFFYAFLTLQILLHSLRIFSGIDAPRPHPLLSLALPHLPRPFPSLIINALSYWKMAGFFLDDLAGLIVGVGLCVAIGGLVDR